MGEDQIIDLTIALESSLLAGVEDELNYRLALRGVALLADTRGWEPSQALELLKGMYAIRSAIAHEGQQLSNLEGQQLSKREKKLSQMLQKLGISIRAFPG